MRTVNHMAEVLWIAAALSGSDTSDNALFGNLQVVAARQLDLSQVVHARRTAERLQSS
jgi:lactate permease